MFIILCSLHKKYCTSVPVYICFSACLNELQARDSSFFCSLARAEAVDMGKELLRRHFINHVTFEHHFEDDYLFYRFVADLKTKALNAQLSHSCVPRNGENKNKIPCRHVHVQ